MRVGNWGIIGINSAIMSSSNDVPDLVREGVSDRGACMMYHQIRLVRFGAHTGRLAAAVGAVENKTHDVRALLIAQLLKVLERAGTVDHAVKVVELVRPRFVVIDL